MKSRLAAALVSTVVVLCSCNRSLHFYDFTQAPGKNPKLERPADLVEVKVKIKTSPVKVEEQRGSLVTTFDVEAAIINGNIPMTSGAKSVRLHLFHDWTDILVKDGAVLTLRFGRDGSLFDIKEFIVTRVGK